MLCQSSIRCKFGLSGVCTSSHALGVALFRFRSGPRLVKRSERHTRFVACGSRNTHTLPNKYDVISRQKERCGKRCFLCSKIPRWSGQSWRTRLEWSPDSSSVVGCVLCQLSVAVVLASNPPTTQYSNLIVAMKQGVRESTTAVPYPRNGQTFALKRCTVVKRVDRLIIRLDSRTLDRMWNSSTNLIYLCTHLRRHRHRHRHRRCPHSCSHWHGTLKL